MPSIIFMRIGVVTNPSDHKTGKVVHQASRFHFKADTILTEVSNNTTACSSIFDKCVARSDNPVEDNGVSSVLRITINLVSYDQQSGPGIWLYKALKRRLLSKP